MWVCKECIAEVRAKVGSYVNIKTENGKELTSVTDLRIEHIFCPCCEREVFDFKEINNLAKWVVSIYE